MRDQAAAGVTGGTCVTQSRVEETLNTYRVFIEYCFFREFSKVCHPSLASTRLLFVVQKRGRPIGSTVQSHCLDNFEGLLQRYLDKREGLQWTVKETQFSWTPCSVRLITKKETKPEQAALMASCASYALPNVNKARLDSGDGYRGVQVTQGADTGVYKSLRGRIQGCTSHPGGGYRGVQVTQEADTGVYKSGAFRPVFVESIRTLQLYRMAITIYSH